MHENAIINPADKGWEMFPEPHGRPTTPTRILREQDPFIIEADFPANFFAAEHWHPFDTIYLFTAGEMKIGNEGAFRPGDIRWVKAGHAYGPEEAGPEGVRFHLLSLGGHVGLNWADLYRVPDELLSRLGKFEKPAGKRTIDTMMAMRPEEDAPTSASMPDEGPVMFKLTLNKSNESREVCLPYRSLWFVREGEIAVDDSDTIGAGLFFCAESEQPYRVRINEDASEVLIFGTSAT